MCPAAPPKIGLRVAAVTVSGAAVPEAHTAAVEAVMAEEGWQESVVVPALSPVEKLAAFVASNQDIAALISSQNPLAN